MTSTRSPMNSEQAPPITGDEVKEINDPEPTNRIGARVKDFGSTTARDDRPHLGCAEQRRKGLRPERSPRSTVGSMVTQEGRRSTSAAPAGPRWGPGTGHGPGRHLMAPAPLRLGELHRRKPMRAPPRPAGRAGAPRSDTRTILHYPSRRVGFHAHGRLGGKRRRPNDYDFVCRPAHQLPRAGRGETNSGPPPRPGDH